jgi:hypothetical protein
MEGKENSMSAPAITICPPGPQRADERFDRYVGTKSQKSKAVTSKTEISFSDFDKMHVKKRPAMSGGQSVIPPWSAEDKNIQLVTAYMLWGMLTMRTACGFPKERYEENPLALVLELEEQLSKRCVDVQGKRRDEIQLATLLGQRKHKTFGYAKLLSKIIYDSFRLVRKSNHIAADLDPLLSACSVRQIRSRAVKVGQVIFPPELNPPISKRAGELHRQDIEYKRARFLAGTGNKVREGRTKNHTLPTTRECFAAIEAGRTVADLSAEHGCHQSIVRDRVRVGRAQKLGKQHPKPRFARIQVLKMWNAGATLEEISEVSGLTIPYVDCLLRNRWNIDPLAPRTTVVHEDLVMATCLRDEQIWRDKLKAVRKARHTQAGTLQSEGMISRHLEMIEEPSDYEKWFSKRSGKTLGSQVDLT